MSQIITVFFAKCPFFLRKISFCFGTLLSKCSALLAAVLSYFVFQILPFLYRLTAFYKMCSSNAVNPWE